MLFFQTLFAAERNLVPLRPLAVQRVLDGLTLFGKTLNNLNKCLINCLTHRLSYHKKNKFRGTDDRFGDYLCTLLNRKTVWEVATTPAAAGTRDRPKCDSAKAPASLSGRISCRSRSKINAKILLFTGAQDLLPEQDLLLEQKLLLDQEHMLEQKLHTSHSRINVLFWHVLLKLCKQNRVFAS